MDPELERLTAGMNAEQIEVFACALEVLAHELRWSALEQIGIIDPMKSNDNN